jgi:hypothetical protein
MRPGNKTVIFACLALATTLAGCLAGCGGGDSTSPLSKAQFIKRADAICERADAAQLKAAAATLSGAQVRGKAQIEKLVASALLPPVRKETEEISALSAPGGDEKEIDAIVGEFDQAREEVEANPAGVLKGSLGTTNKRAAQYGFKACAEPL